MTLSLKRISAKPRLVPDGTDLKAAVRRVPSGSGAKPKPPLEKVVQRGIVQLFRSVGCSVSSTSQYRPSMVTPGMPDLYVTHPTCGVWFWFEVKRPQLAGFKRDDTSTWIPEPLRPAQATFRLECQLTGQPHFFGGMAEAVAALVALGLATTTDGSVRLLSPSRRCAA